MWNPRAYGRGQAPSWQTVGWRKHPGPYGPGGAPTPKKKTAGCLRVTPDPMGWGGIPIPWGTAPSHAEYRGSSPRGSAARGSVRMCAGGVRVAPPPAVRHKHIKSGHNCAAWMPPHCLLSFLDRICCMISYTFLIHCARNSRNFSPSFLIFYRRLRSKPC